MASAPGAEHRTETFSVRRGSAVPPHFILRRLHSLCGIIPLGIFLLFHLIIGVMVMNGKETYDSIYRFLYRSPIILWLQIIFVLIPLVFHTVYGIRIALKSRPNPFSYPYRDNWRFAIQRLSGFILIVFLIAHLFHIWLFLIADHFQLTWDGWGSSIQGTQVIGVSTYDVVRDLLSDYSFMVIYTLGVVTAAFHLANGLWSSCITWGIVVTDGGRRVAGWLAAFLFLVLSFLGLWTVQAFYAGRPIWPWSAG